MVKKSESSSGSSEEGMELPLTEEPTIELVNGQQDYQPIVKMPKWLKYPLMVLPAGIIAGIVITIDKTVGFPETLFPAAVLALTGLSLFFLVVLGDMVYRQVYVFRMLRQESRKARIYQEILKDRKERQRAQSKYEYDEEEEEVMDEYEYDEEDEEAGEIDEEEEGEEEDEYFYELEDDEQPNYRIKSYVIRGGLLTILMTNSIMLLILAAILQYTLYGGFIVPTNSSTTIF